MATADVSAKTRIRNLLEQQPDDSSYDEILRELALHRMWVDDTEFVAAVA